jgi:hypothetical protein
LEHDEVVEEELTMSETPAQSIKRLSWRYATAADGRQAVYQVGTFHRAAEQRPRTESADKLSGTGSPLDPPPGSNHA